MAKKKIDWEFDGKIDIPRPMSAKDYYDVYSVVDIPEIIPTEPITEQIENNQREQIKIANEQVSKLNEVVATLKKQNDELKKQAEENEKQMKKQKWWNWITFILSLGVAIASLIVAA